MKKISKLLLFSVIGLGLLVPTVVLTTTSCSATPSSAPFNYSIKIGTTTFNYNNGSISCNPALSIGTNAEGKPIEYTSPPKLDDKDPNTYKANAVFEVVNILSNKINNVASQISQVISRIPASKNQATNIISNLPASVSASGLDFALGSFLGSGSGTYRLKITGIELTSFSNFIQQIMDLTNGPNNENTTKPNPTPIEFTGVTINYGWWRSDGGNSTSMINQEQFNQINKDAFINSNVPPQMTYTLTFQPMKVNLIQAVASQEDATKFPLTGGVIFDGEFPIFAGLETENNNLTTFMSDIDYLIKVGQGDLKEQTLVDAIKTQQGQFVNNNITKIIKS